MTPMTIAEAQSAILRAMPLGATYKVAEAALMVGLHEDTVRRRIRAGKLRTWGSPQPFSPISLPQTRRDAVKSSRIPPFFSLQISREDVRAVGGG